MAPNNGRRIKILVFTLSLDTQHSLLSLVLEKVVANQLNSNINSSNTSHQYQSAYKKLHSTETTVLTFHIDIPASMDDGKVPVLTFFFFHCLRYHRPYYLYEESWWLIRGGWQRHSTWLNHIRLEVARGLSQVTACPPKLISNLEFLNSQFRSCAFHRPHHSAEQHDLWMCYPSPSLCWRQPVVCLFCIRGLYCGTVWFAGVLGVLAKYLPLTHIYQQSSAHAFIT